MAMSIGQCAPVFLPREPPSLTENPGLQGFSKSWAGQKQPWMHRCKTFYCLWQLCPSESWVWRWHSCLACGDAGGTLCGDTDCLHRGSYGPTRVFFWASCSWSSESLFDQSFSIAPPIQAHRGASRMGSSSVDLQSGPETRILGESYSFTVSVVWWASLSI